jgi:hydroxyproline O-arabinosyltransferase
MNVSLKMKADQQTDKAFGWVLEMSVQFNQLLVILLNMFIPIHLCFPVHIHRYAYAVASALHGVRHSLRKDFMIQVLRNIVSRYISSLFVSVSSYRDRCAYL